MDKVNYRSNPEAQAYWTYVIEVNEEEKAARVKPILGGNIVKGDEWIPFGRLELIEKAPSPIAATPEKFSGPEIVNLTQLLEKMIADQKDYDKRLTDIETNIDLLEQAIEELQVKKKD